VNQIANDDEPLPLPFSDGVPVRRGPGRERADEWALVLMAVGIPHRVERAEGGELVVVVPTASVGPALRALGASDREAAEGQAVAPEVPDRGTHALGIVVAMLLVGFQFVTGLWESRASSGWFAVGVADAARIRGGEWWRAITAMTLHADVMHVFGNVAASVIFVGAAGRWLGPGVAAALILLAGTGANLLTAAAEERDHLSVGASTATFAALGLVVGLQVVRRWRGGGPIRRRAWVAAGAGLALLAMLGVGARADVFAHAFGLGLGTVCGIVAGIADPPRVVMAPGAPRVPVALGMRVAQAALACAVLGAVALAWARAFGRI
jgi:rhomboid protease GluP